MSEDDDYKDGFESDSEDEYEDRPNRIPQYEQSDSDTNEVEAKEREQDCRRESKTPMQSSLTIGGVAAYVGPRKTVTYGPHFWQNWSHGGE